MKKLIALFSSLILFSMTSAFAACPLSIKHNNCGCQKSEVISVAQPCAKPIIKERCGCKVIKRNPCTGEIQKSFMNRTFDTTKSIYSDTLGTWYDASFGALFNAYID